MSYQGHFWAQGRYRSSVNGYTGFYSSGPFSKEKSPSNKKSWSRRHASPGRRGLAASRAGVGPGALPPDPPPLGMSPSIEKGGPQKRGFQEKGGNETCAGEALRGSLGARFSPGLRLRLSTGSHHHENTKPAAFLQAAPEMPQLLSSSGLGPPS